MQASIYNQIIDYCYSKIVVISHKPVLFVVTGDSGSGKSYYSALLRKKFEQENVALTYIDADDFLISRQDREPMKRRFYSSGEFKGKTYWEILENMFRLNEFKMVISDLRSSRSSSYYPYERETGKISTLQKTVTSNDFVLFDSSMLLDLMDFVIRVDVDRQNILERKVARDSDVRTPEQIVEMHQKVQGYYWDRCYPRHPNIIIDNNDFSHPSIVKS